MVSVKAIRCHQQSLVRLKERKTDSCVIIDIAIAYGRSFNYFSQDDVKFIGKKKPRQFLHPELPNGLAH